MGCVAIWDSSIVLIPHFALLCVYFFLCNSTLRSTLPHNPFLPATDNDALFIGLDGGAHWVRLKTVRQTERTERPHYGETIRLLLLFSLLLFSASSHFVVVIISLFVQHFSVAFFLDCFFLL